MPIFAKKIVILYQNSYFSQMSTVKIKDKTFKTFIPESEIKERIKKLAARINEDMADKNPT